MEFFCCQDSPGKQAARDLPLYAQTELHAAFSSFDSFTIYTSPISGM